MARIYKLESVGQLAGGIAHDFNNYLTAILGNISLAKMRVTTDSLLPKLLDETEKTSLRARDLTHQLLTFARGGAPIRQTASIAEIVKDSANFVLSGSNVRCSFNIADDLWPVEIDQSQVSQALNNRYREAMADGRRFSAVILDLTISGGMGGRDAVMALLDMDPQVKSIVSSGYSTDPIMADSASHGFCGVMAKPYKIEQVVKVLQEVL